MGSTGKMMVTVINGHVTGIPTYFPSPDGDARKNQLIMNITVNGKKKTDGTRPATIIPVKIWGKYGNIAAHQLKNGSCVNVTGELSSWRRDTGKTENGKRVFEERISINCDSFMHGGATGKELAELVNKNIAELNDAKAKGTIRPDAPLTIDIMLKKPEPTVVPDFNIALANQTGMYGNAKVWTKDRGFLGTNAAVSVAAPRNNAVSMGSAVIDEKINKLESLIAQVQAMNASAAQTESVDGFAAVGV
jgi:single-stranded DNA-binding protein